MASNAAIEGFLRPGFFDSDHKHSCDLSSTLLVLARWVLLVIFFVTIGVSSLYLIQRLLQMIEAANWLGMTATLVLCLIMTFNMWSTLVFVFNWILRCSSGKWAEKSRTVMMSIHQYLVEMMAAGIFGIDVKDTDGGEMIGTEADAGNNKELHSRIDKLEKTLERLLIHNLTNNEGEKTNKQ